MRGRREDSDLSVSLWGFIAYVLLYLSVAGGTAMSARSLRRTYVAAFGPHLHEALSLVALFAMFLHGLEGLPPWRGATLLAWLLVVPGRQPDLVIATGIVALYTGALVLASFYLRRRVGSPLWRWLHALAYPAFALAAWHALASGANGWLISIQVLYALTVGSVALLAAIRLAEALARHPVAGSALPRRRGQPR